MHPRGGVHRHHRPEFSAVRLLMKKVRVLLADDHMVVRDGLRLLINGQRDMRVVGEAADGQEAIQKAHELKPDVVVMDLSMPKVNGLQATERLRVEQPEVKVVALTVHEDASYLLQLCKAGAAGYVLKRSAGDDLIQAIRDVARGVTHFDPMLASEALMARPAPDLPITGRGKQQQGDRQQPPVERQDRRDLPAPGRRESRSAEPNRDGAVRIAPRVVERELSPCQAARVTSTWARVRESPDMTSPLCLTAPSGAP